MLLARVTLGDFDRFWSTFTSAGAEQRRKYGSSGARVFRNVGRPEEVIVLFDWSEEALVRAWAGALRVLAPGSLVAWRQLNNQRDWRPLFAPDFEEEAALGAEWTARERALFYERVTVVRRR